MLKEELNHRDLKPKNILISLSTLNKNIIKLLIMVQQKQFLKQ